MKKLTQYYYPGNVRDLKNTVYRAAMLSEGSEIGPESLEFLSATLDDQVMASEIYRPGATLAEVEKEMIRKALVENDFKTAAAAKQLDVARTTLQDKIKRYGLDGLK